MSEILFVDDEADIAEACVGYLQLEGYDAGLATNATDAIRVIEKDKPLFLIIDLNLREKLSGLDVLKKALDVNPTARAAILTGHSEEDVEKKCRAAGALAVYRKPMPLENFKEIVEELKRGGRAGN